MLHKKEVVKFLSLQCIYYKKLNTINDALLQIDYNNEKDFDNLPMQHSQKTIERFSYIPEGGNIQDVLHKIPKNLHISKYSIYNLS